MSSQQLQKLCRIKGFRVNLVNSGKVFLAPKKLPAPEPSRISRTPYPPIGEAHHLAIQRKLRSPKLKNEAQKKLVKLGDPLKEKCLYITVTLGPFEIKVFTHCNCCWGLF